MASLYEPEESLNEGVPLIATLMQRSANDLAHTTNLIIEGMQRDIERLEGLLEEVLVTYDAATVVDRATEKRMGPIMYRIEGVLESARRRKERQ